MCGVMRKTLVICFLLLLPTVQCKTIAIDASHGQETSFYTNFSSIITSDGYDVFLLNKMTESTMFQEGSPRFDGLIILNVSQVVSADQVELIKSFLDADGGLFVSFKDSELELQDLEQEIVQNGPSYFRCLEFDKPYLIQGQSIPFATGYYMAYMCPVFNSPSPLTDNNYLFFSNNWHAAVIYSDAMFTNEHIGSYDHAYLGLSIVKWSVQDSFVPPPPSQGGSEGDKEEGEAGGAPPSGDVGGEQPPIEEEGNQGVITESGEPIDEEFQQKIIYKEQKKSKAYIWILLIIVVLLLLAFRKLGD